MQSEQVLGPRWSLKELRTFYILLKAHGRQWEKLEERLPLRSGAMVRALFEMHRGYLSLPEASVEGFSAIMLDHYEMQDELQQQRQSVNQRAVQGLTDQHTDADADADGDVEMEMVGVKQEQGCGQQDEPAARSRKKRRLEKLLATDQLATLRIRSEGDGQVDDQRTAVDTRKQRGRKSLAPSRSRAWLPRGLGDDSGLGKVQGARFDLPWGHWFYSYVDVDFFRHNEFIECLNGMGLGKITTAARPIWSSVRASMGRPRRLSPLFFTQEKEKLESYRELRRLDPAQMPSDRTWPYRCAIPLRVGVAVIVWVESERRFRLATVAAFTATEDTCQVFYCGNISRLEAVTCSLDNIMVLDFPPWSGRTEASIAEPPLAATTLLRRENVPRGSGSSLVTPQANDTVGNRFREEKIRVVLAVKTLLYRKEKILVAMRTLNKRVAEQQTQQHEKNAMKSSLWTTPTAFSSAAVKDLVWTDSREKGQLQKQHSWLAANLDTTNAHLKAALLSLQSFSSSKLAEGVSYLMGRAYPSEGQSWDSDSNLAPTETLTEEQMRWAIDFLSASQQKATNVVAESALHVVNEDKTLSSLNAPANDVHLGSVLPETMQLVANCVTLMSVLHRHVAASPDVPSVITQKLVERVLELLKPSHEANMDLYAELRTAAEAAKAQMAMLASTVEPE